MLWAFGSVSGIFMFSKLCVCVCVCVCWDEGKQKKEAFTILPP